VRVDYELHHGLNEAGAVAERAEKVGYDAVWATETGHDPFLPLLLAAERTERLRIGTAIAVAFARNPMTTAVTAFDLQTYSGGRFMLGLGSQIKPHIERRFSMPWSHPAQRMREFISALHAIWDCWQNGTKLDFRGDYYTHTLMTPFFSPRPCEWGAPPVLLAAVGEAMTRVAAEVADGMLVHSFTTERYLREVTLPVVERGLQTSGRPRDRFQLAYAVLIATGTTEEELHASLDATRRRIAFYGSTPAYRPVLELHGWGPLQTELHALSREGRWDDMGTLIDDDVLDAFAVTGEPDTIAAGIRARVGDLVDRVTFYTAGRTATELTDRIVADLSSPSR
jgi:probable F420-dependent oxidoreductase